MIKSWKQELDYKYRKLMNSGDVKAMDAANIVITEAIDKLDSIIKQQTEMIKAVRRDSNAS